MPYSITEIDGVQIDPVTKRFPIEVKSERHMLNGPEHDGVLDDHQIPTSILRSAAHRNDPHTMLIDGRDVSVDGAKLDTIESGAEVNNLSDMQAQDLTSGIHTSWHNHDSYYYRKSDIQVAGMSRIAWGNLTDIPSSFTPSEHDHNLAYYTKTQLDAGQLDARYYTESEADVLFAGKSDVSHLHDERYYLKGEVDVLLADKADAIHDHNDHYYLKGEVDTALTAKSDLSHIHDDRYYPRSEVDALLSGKSESTHLHDDRYFTESEVTSLLSGKANTSHDHNSAYYTKTQLDAGQLDTRYYTESEVDAMIHAASIGVKGAVDTFADLPSSGNTSGEIYIVKQTVEANEEGFYRWNGTAWIFLVNNTGVETHNELSGINVGDYKHLTQMEYTDLTDGGETTLHVHDGRYHTKTESDALFAATSHNHDSAYYTKTQLDAGQLDARYYTKTNLQTGGQASVAWANLTGVPTSFTPSSHTHSTTQITSGILSVARGGNGNASFTSSKFLAFDGTKIASTSFDQTSFAAAVHNHDSTYYTKAQLDAGQLDTRYYSESEIDVKLGLKSDADHLHDDRYFTETEVTDLISGKADAVHSHDDRYFTETEISASFYTKLNSDARYAGISHIHDQYYTKSEADAIHSNTTYATISANDPYTDVTGQELESLTNGSNADGLHTHDFSGAGASTLDEAYGDYGVGRVVTVDAGPVQLNAQGGFAPLKLNPINYTPNQWLGGGEMCIRDGELFIYDAARGKWLSSDATSVTVSGNSSTTSGYLYIDNTPMNNTLGICIPFDATITAISFSNQNDDASGTIDIRVWGSTVRQVSFCGYTMANKTLNVDVGAEDVIQLFCNASGGGRPNKPIILIMFKKRI